MTSAVPVSRLEERGGAGGGAWVEEESRFTVLVPVAAGEGDEKRAGGRPCSLCAIFLHI